jgi:hypothetical protein
MRLVLMVLLLFGTSPGWAALDEQGVRASVAHYAPALALLSNNCIRVELLGGLEVEMKAVLLTLSRDNLLEEIQRQYATLLPPGDKPEFEIKLAASNHYYYVNSSQQRSDIVEVFRKEVEQGRLRGVYYTSGRRFFGKFEAVTMIDIHTGKGDDVVYEVRVWAYPHVAVSRFFARQFGLVDRYFKSKSHALEKIAVKICRSMLE